MKGIDPDLYPFESHFETIYGHQYHYVEEGKGEPVVMLHGNPTWSFYYRELIKKLSPYFHCLAPDHIGCGYSDKPGDSVRLPTSAIAFRQNQSRYSSATTLYECFYQDSENFQKCHKYRSCFRLLWGLIWCR